MVVGSIVGGIVFIIKGKGFDEIVNKVLVEVVGIFDVCIYMYLWVEGCWVVWLVLGDWMLLKLFWKWKGRGGVWSEYYIFYIFLDYFLVWCDFSSEEYINGMSRF